MCEGRFIYFSNLKLIKQFYLKKKFSFFGVNETKHFTHKKREVIIMRYIQCESISFFVLLFFPRFDSLSCLKWKTHSRNCCKHFLFCGNKVYTVHVYCVLYSANKVFTRCIIVEDFKFLRGNSIVCELIISLDLEFGTIWKSDRNYSQTDAVLFLTLSIST